MVRKNIRFTTHAIKRKLERNISDEQIRQTLENPDHTVSHAGTKVAARRLDEKIIRIVYVEEETHIKIITVY
jgi:hypothetical protein